MKSFASPEQKRPLWQLLLAPMLFLSLGLHALLLVVPIAPSEEDLIPPPSPEEEAGIAITRIEPPTARVATTSGSPAAAGPAATQQKAAAGKTNPASAQGATGNSAGATRRAARSTSTATSRTNRPRSTASAPRTPRNPPPANLSTDPAAANPGASAPNPAAPAVPTSRDVPKALQDYIAMLRTDYAYRPINTTPTEIEANTATWLTEMRAETGQPSLTPQALTSVAGVEYPLRSCLPIAPLAAQVGVHVDASEAVVGSAALLRSTGYLSLNKAAIAAAKEYRFPDGDGDRLYVVEVPVQYDSDRCVRLASGTIP